MFERFRKNATKAVIQAVKEETLKSLDDLMPLLVGLASVTGLCVGIFGKSTPVGTTITINNFYYGKR